MFGELERLAQESGVISMRVVDSTSEAEEVKRHVMEEFSRQRAQLQKADLMNAHAIVARIDEKISKLALLYAISENPYAPKITRAAVEWATAFSVHVVRWMLDEAQFHLAEGKFGKLMERAVASMSRKGGSIGRRDLIQKLHCDVNTFTRLIKTMVIAGEIEEPEVIVGKVVYRLMN